MRRAFAETLVELAEQDPWVIFLTGDLGFQCFDTFKERFGRRYVNVGVAEAQLVCCAAGLALEGWRPIIYSIASFATGRPFEQLRICLSYHELPVVVVGAGGGYTYADSGVTHHAGEDLGLMSLLPGMTVVAPGDPSETRQLLPQLIQLEGPSYIRVGRYGEPCYEAPEPAILGRARQLCDGERVALLSTGDLAIEVLGALEQLAADHIHPLAYQLHTVKPLDTAILETLSRRVHTMIVVEEHLPSGGLAAAVSAWAAARTESPRVLRLGAPDGLVLGSPGRKELRQRLGLDASSIADTCRRAWSHADLACARDV